MDVRTQLVILISCDTEVLQMVMSGNLVKWLCLHICNHDALIFSYLFQTPLIKCDNFAYPKTMLIDNNLFKMLVNPSNHWFLRAKQVSNNEYFGNQAYQFECPPFFYLYMSMIVKKKLATEEFYTKSLAFIKMS